jgi:dihydrofolate reductase
MGSVIFNMSMSLDGFIGGPNGEVDRLFQWYGSGDTAVPFPGTDLEFRVARASAALFQKVWPTIGAMVTGRRNFDGAAGWGGKPPLGVPHFVVTHSVPQEWVTDESPFTFVTDGVASAVAQAKQAAGEKHVAVSSANIMQQCLRAGLVDEIHIDMVPVLLGAGIRLFEHLDSEPIGLEQIGVIEGSGVTHLRFRVLK